MSPEIDENGYLTTGECVEEYIKRKLEENPQLYGLIGEVDPMEETRVEETTTIESGRHGSA
jgi:hypothetical protein